MRMIFCLCINTGEKQATPALSEFADDDVTVKNKRFAFPNNQFYLKNTAEMLTAFETCRRHWIIPMK